MRRISAPRCRPVHRWSSQLFARPPFASRPLAKRLLARSRRPACLRRYQRSLQSQHPLLHRCGHWRRRRSRVIATSTNRFVLPSIRRRRLLYRLRPQSRRRLVPRARGGGSAASATNKTENGWSERFGPPVVSGLTGQTCTRTLAPAHTRHRSYADDAARPDTADAALCSA